MKSIFVASILAAASLVLTHHSDAATCSRVPTAKFDSFYAPKWGCQQVFVNDMWSRFDFDHDDWDQGFGYDDPCNDNLPLKRTFNALMLLGYGVTNTPTCSTSSANVGMWAYCWSGNSIDELDGMCGNSPRARTNYTPGIDNYTNLYMAFFYDETVVQRAGTIFHEARHAQGFCSHTSGCVDGNDSCDPNFNNGCVGVGSGSGRGANAYTVLYMNWFATTARPDWINQSIKDDAIAEATRYLNNRFETDPCFRLDSNGFSFQTC
jgi:hypothetical protein